MHLHPSLFLTVAAQPTATEVQSWLGEQHLLLPPWGLLCSTYKQDLQCPLLYTALCSALQVILAAIEHLVAWTTYLHACRPALAAQALVELTMMRTTAGMAIFWGLPRTAWQTPRSHGRPGVVGSDVRDV